MVTFISVVRSDVVAWWLFGRAWDATTRPPRGKEWMDPSLPVAVALLFRTPDDVTAKLHTSIQKTTIRLSWYKTNREAMQT
jgi:hypothetical protein